MTSSGASARRHGADPVGAPYDVAVAALDVFGLARGSRLARPRVELIGHWENTVYLVDAECGRLVLRVHRPDARDVEMVRAELEWLRSLRKHGLRVPTPGAGSPAASVASIVAATGDSHLCSLLSWTPGTTPVTMSPAIAEAAGTQVGRIHVCGFERSTRDGPFVRPRLDVEWLVGKERGGLGAGARALRDLTDAHSQVWKRALDPIADAFALLQQRGVHMIPIHGDFHLGNVVVDDGDVMGVIDFDDCGVGMPHYDIATFLHRYREDDEWIALRDAFLRGYEAVAPKPVAVEETLDALMLARRVNMLMWMAARAPDHPTIGAQLPEVLERSRVLLDVVRQPRYRSRPLPAGGQAR